MQYRISLLIPLVAACASSTPAPMAPAPAPAPAPATGTLQADTIVGYWSGDWGNLVFQVDGDRILGSYNHDEGTIVGTIQGDLLVGWWCEAPSRQADADAGEVEMKFVTNPDGSRQIDGRWRYGSTAEWKEDWDVSYSTSEAPPELVARFSDASVFCPKP